MSNFQNSMCVGLTLLLTVFLTVQSRTFISTTIAQDYLKKYGYLAKGSRFSEALTDKNGLSEALQDFQKLGGINVTGELDEATLNLMSVPRCGVADKVEKTNKNRFKRYNVQGSHWARRNLLYKISKYSKHLTKAAVDTEIARAFSMWSKYTDLTFTQKKSGQVNIDIKFVEGKHGDSDPFDGHGGIMAHAYFPVFGGDTHFDDAEQWTIYSPHGSNLFQVAVHEFGHALGLQHSNVKSSVMAPFYRGYDQHFKLDQDDIEGIQALYGKKSSITPHLCENHKIDAVLTSLNGETIILKGDQYYLINGRVIANGYPKPIADKWPHLPGNIDAAFTDVKGDNYFFKNDKVWIYSNDKLNDGYPRLIREIFPTIPNNLDAVLHIRKTKEYLFFKGNMCYYISTHPGNINSFFLGTNLLNLPSNIDAAFEDGKGDGYAIKNDEVIKLSKRKSVVERPFKFTNWLYQC